MNKMVDYCEGRECCICAFCDDGIFCTLDKDSYIRGALEYKKNVLSLLQGMVDDGIQRPRLENVIKQIEELE